MAENKQNSTGKKKGATLTDNLFDLLNPDNVLGNAQRVISSAVNVLEEEIAAGILAAKRIEKKVIDTDSLKSDPDDLMNRIRRDTHEAIDIFLDAFAALSKQVGILNTTLTKNNTAEATTATKSTNAAANVFTVIEADAPAKAGQTIKLSMSIGNTATKETVKVQLVKNNLTGNGTQKILSRYITLTPATFNLKPGEEKEVTIIVKLPAAVKAGRYCSLITDANNTLVKTVFEITVTA
ncbi:hypothetical protein [Ferruginibacter sp. SUN106]|uniref:hypothetical protein n=1 Tax=Ferruginibacter sp. SUN106 TaxID=2978348 RepID=UPI003D362647